MQALRKSLNADIQEDWAACPERWCGFWSPVVFRRPPTQDLLIHSVFFFFQMSLPGILLSLELGLQPKGFWRSASFLNGPPWDSSSCGTYLLAQELLLLTKDRKRILIGSKWKATKIAFLKQDQTRLIKWVIKKIYKILVQYGAALVGTWWCWAGLHESLQPGCEEMKREWGNEEETERKWRENEEMERKFPHSSFISSLSIHFLYQNLSHFVAKC